MVPSGQPAGRLSCRVPTPSRDGGAGATWIDLDPGSSHRWTVIHLDDRHDFRFAIWTGHGRDPEVAYLDGRLLAIATTELGTTGLRIYPSGVSSNVLGGERRGDIDPAALHRIVHAAVDVDRGPIFELDEPCDGPVGVDGLCEAARREPRPGTPADPVGSFAIEDGFALQWCTWEDAGRDGVLRRAVYVDERFLLEAGLGRDAAVRAWPARGLLPYGLELVTPAAGELAVIEGRISRLTGATR